jgi:DNA-binding response OmpR family regulator
MQIAVLDDDAHQLELLSRVVEAMGHVSHRFSDGSSLLAAMKRATFDLLLVDWELPGVSGIDVVQTVRAEGAAMPIVMVTHRDAERDVVKGLTTGADDYVVKPVRSAELKARLLALLRRAYPETPRSQWHGPFAWATATGVWHRHGTPIDLKPREFDLAVCLFKNIGRLLSRDYLMQSIWGREADVPTRTLDTHVSAVRAKLGLRSEHGYRLSAVYGHGYRLETLEPPSDPDQGA